MLHGLNMVYKRPPYAPDAIGFGADDAAFLASRGLQHGPPRPDLQGGRAEAGRRTTTPTSTGSRTRSNVLGRHGIVSLLDFHQDMYNERFRGEGWPDWAVHDDGLPGAAVGAASRATTWRARRSTTRSTTSGPTTPAASASGPLRRRLAPRRRLASSTTASVLGYDLLNEPWPGTRVRRTASNPRAALSSTRSSRPSTRDVRRDSRRRPAHARLLRAATSSSTTEPTRTSPSSTTSTLGMSFHDYCLTANEGESGSGRGVPAVRLARLRQRRQALATRPATRCCSPSSAPPTHRASLLRPAPAGRPAT